MYGKHVAIKNEQEARSRNTQIDYDAIPEPTMLQRIIVMKERNDIIGVVNVEINTRASGISVDRHVVGDPIAFQDDFKRGINGTFQEIARGGGVRAGGRDSKKFITPQQDEDNELRKTLELRKEELDIRIKDLGQEAREKKIFKPNPTQRKIDVQENRHHHVEKGVSDDERRRTNDVYEHTEYSVAWVCGGHLGDEAIWGAIEADVLYNSKCSLEQVNKWKDENYFPEDFFVKEKEILQKWEDFYAKNNIAQLEKEYYQVKELLKEFTETQHITFNIECYGPDSDLYKKLNQLLDGESRWMTEVSYQKNEADEMRLELSKILDERGERVEHEDEGNSEQVDEPVEPEKKVSMSDLLGKFGRK